MLLYHYIGVLDERDEKLGRKVEYFLSSKWIEDFLTQGFVRERTLSRPRSPSQKWAWLTALR